MFFTSGFHKDWQHWCQVNGPEIPWDNHARQTCQVIQDAHDWCANHSSTEPYWYLVGTTRWYFRDTQAALEFSLAWGTG